MAEKTFLQLLTMRMHQLGHPWTTELLSGQGLKGDMVRFGSSIQMGREASN
jgi:hypothetical protein